MCREISQIAPPVHKIGHHHPRAKVSVICRRTRKPVGMRAARGFRDYNYTYTPPCAKMQAVTRRAYCGRGAGQGACNCNGTREAFADAGCARFRGLQLHIHTPLYKEMQAVTRRAYCGRGQGKARVIAMVRASPLLMRAARGFKDYNYTYTPPCTKMQAVTRRAYCGRGQVKARVIAMVRASPLLMRAARGFGDYNYTKHGTCKEEGHPPPPQLPDHVRPI